MAINTASAEDTNNKKQNEWTQDVKVSVPEIIQDCDYDTAISVAGKSNSRVLLS